MERKIQLQCIDYFIKMFSNSLDWSYVVSRAATQLRSIYVLRLRGLTKNLPQKILENLQQKARPGVFLLIKSQSSCKFLKKETPTQRFHCEFC